jgi:hypothetical protein
VNDPHKKLRQAEREKVMGWVNSFERIVLVVTAITFLLGGLFMLYGDRLLPPP